MAEQSDSASPSETEAADSRPDGWASRIRGKLRMRLWPIRQRLTRRKWLRESLRHHKEWDFLPSTQPPDDEHVRWVGFWMVELYAPSHSDALARGLAQFEGTGSAIGPRNDDLTSVLPRMRARSGGELFIGHYSSRKSSFGTPNELRLPAEFASASLWLKHLGQGVSAVITEFRLADDHQHALDALLHRDFEAAGSLTGMGHQIIPAQRVKTQAVGAARARYRALGSTWLWRKLPGLFASLPDGEPPDVGPAAFSAGGACGA